MRKHCPAPSTPNSAAIAQRLLAHARLCVEIAQDCWNEETATRLRTMASECTRAAVQMQALSNAGPQTMR